MTGFCCGTRLIESLPAQWISHGGGAGWINGWMDRWMFGEKKVLCNKDYKTMTCYGPFSAVPTLAAAALLHTDEVEFSTVTWKTNKHTQASMYGIFSPLL